LRQRKRGKGDARPLLTTAQTKFFARDPTRTQAPVISPEDDLAGEGGEGGGRALAGGDGWLRFEDACHFPRLFRFTEWISTCTTSPWRSLQNLHMVIVLAAFIASLLVNWIYIVPRTALGDYDYLILAGGGLLGISLLVFTISTFLTPLFDFESFFGDAFGFVHPEKAGKGVIGERAKVVFSTFFAITFGATVSLYLLYVAITLVGIVIPQYTIEASAVLVILCLLSYPVFARGVMVILVTPLEVYLLTRLVSMNFEVLDSIGAGDGGDLEGHLNRFLFLHARMLAVTEQYSARKQWHLLLTLAYGVVGTVGSLLVTTYSVLEPTSQIFGQVLAAFTATTMAAFVIIPAFTVSLLRQHYDSQVTQFCRGHAVLAPDLPAFLQLQQYLDRWPIVVGLFGQDITTRSVIFTALPLVVSSGFSIVRLFVDF